MSYVKIMLHCVWSTKNREPLLDTKEMRRELFNHIYHYALKNEIFIEQIGGEKDHIHCLLSLGKEQNIAKVMNLIKGESSYWASRRYEKKIAWQNDYFAVSVSESALHAVKSYIQNQEEHHKRKDFQKESDEFMKIYKFNINKLG